MRRKPRWKDANACIRLLQHFSSSNASADEINNKLVDFFLMSPPSLVELQRLSLLQQEYDGTNGIEDFACSTVFLCSQQAIIDQNNSGDTKLIARITSIRSITSFSELEKINLGK